MNLTFCCSTLLGLTLLGLPCVGAAKGNSFLKTINKSRRIDPYNTRLKSGTIFGGIQIGEQTKYSLNPVDQLFAEYYYKSTQVIYLKVPNNDLDNLTLGASYMKYKFLGDKTWMGLEFQPNGPTITAYMRGLFKKSGRSHFYYKGSVSMIEDGQSLGVHGGFYSRPFLATRNTFIDLRGEYSVVSQNSLDSSFTTLSAEIGQGWARFLKRKGLELYGALGFEYSKVDTSIGDGVLTQSDTGMRISIGLQYHHR